MTTYSESDTKDNLTDEQLQLMARSNHDFLIDYLGKETRFDAHRIRLMLEFGQEAVKAKLEGL